MIEADRLITSSPREREEQQDRAIRPLRLADYTGQPVVREQMALFIQAARGRAEALDRRDGVRLPRHRAAGRALRAARAVGAAPEVWAAAPRRLAVRRAQFLARNFPARNSPRTSPTDAPSLPAAGTSSRSPRPTSSRAFSRPSKASVPSWRARSPRGLAPPPSTSSVTTRTAARSPRAPSCSRCPASARRSST